jgi:hypothetical protein
VLGGAYKFVLAEPEKPAPKPKVAGDPYVVPKEFLLNLDDGRYAKLTLALILPHEVNDAPAEAEAEGGPPEGWGSQPQEGVVRAVVTEMITGSEAASLLVPARRDKLEKRLLRELRKKTDLKPVDVSITDLAVQ